MSMYIDLCLFYFIEHHVLQEVVVWELFTCNFFLKWIEHMMIKLFHL
jgi:hypothetical protein